MNKQPTTVLEWQRRYESLEGYCYQSIACLLGIIAQMYFGKWQIAVPLALVIYAFFNKFVASKPYTKSKQTPGESGI